MKTFLITALALVALTGATALATPAVAAGTATKVTIKGEDGDYYGKVKSADRDCVSDREVEVYKMRGSSPSPKSDKRVGSDLSDSNGDWSTGNSGYKRGDFYAVVKKSDGCGGATSKVLSR